MPDIVILSAKRTPIGSFQGALSRVSAPRLGGTALRGAVDAAGVEPTALDQIYLGCVLPAGLGQAPARQAAFAAGCPPSAGAVTINKVCGSGMRAIMTAANDLRCGDYGVVAAGGMESMSQAPYLAPRIRDGLRLGHGQLLDSMIHDGLWDPYGDVHMGSCAELCARKYEFSRQQQDEYAISSYQRAQAAQSDGRFAAELVSVEVEGRRGVVTEVASDEEPGRSNFDKMATLKPAFDRQQGTITPANASTINDGAAALVMTTAERAASLGVTPMARLRAQATHAAEPEWFTTAPVAAIEKVLDRAGLQKSEIDLYEINEAFSVVTMACMRELDLDRDQVNVNGGAVALGHPIGASGARIVVTLLHALEQRQQRFGCAAICLGGGEATAVVVERLDSGR